MYHLLYADDGLLLPSGRDFWRRALFWLYVLELFEVPLSWRKVAGGTSLCWIGYQLDVFKFEKGIGPGKVQLLGRWIGERLSEGCVQGCVGVPGSVGFGRTPALSPHLLLHTVYIVCVRARVELNS